MDFKKEPPEYRGTSDPRPNHWANGQGFSEKGRKEMVSWLVRRKSFPEVHFTSLGF